MENLIIILKQLASLFGDFEILQKQKLTAITDNNLKLLETSMKQEQAQILKLKGLDKKRDLALASLNLENLSFKEIIAQIEDQALQLELQSIYSNLETNLKAFQDAQNAVKTLLEANLHTIDKIFESAGIQPTPGLTNTKI